MNHVLIAIVSLFLSLPALAANDQVCVKQDGIFIADVQFFNYDGLSKRFYKSWYNDLMVGQTASSAVFSSSNGDYVDVYISHYVFIGVGRETCRFEKLNRPVTIHVTGTTLDYQCTLEEGDRCH